MSDSPIGAVTRLVSGRGIHARPWREAIALLTDAPRTLDELVRASTLPRRSVEALLAALGTDLHRADDLFGLRLERATAYRERFGYEELRRNTLADPLGGRLRDAEGLVQRLRRAVAAAPAPLAALDHVPATAETVVRRALWLDSTYELAGAHLVFLGDHDLTSLAVCQVRPEARVTVVDVDDRTLAFLDELAARWKVRLRCLFGDLRFGLSPAVVASADLVMTDPPYTAEGVRLFLARGAQSLRDRIDGRVVMAYGFSDQQPALGLKVQQAALGLHLVFAAILPAFNRYQGAQALGSASDLYVCRPTSGTWRTLDRQAEEAATIYTRGPQAIEATSTGGRDLGRLLREPARTVPPQVDLSADPGGWLLRALLAINAEHATLLVPNDHPDLATEAGQRDLRDLLQHKYDLRYRRSFPSPRQALVEADLVDAGGLSSAGRLIRFLQDHAHGRIANIWREGLIELFEGLTRNQARSLMEQESSGPDVLEARLLDLPRHQLRHLGDQAGASARL